MFNEAIKIMGIVNDTAESDKDDTLFDEFADE